jgi:hypothetical protein
MVVYYITSIWESSEENGLTQKQEVIKKTDKSAQQD